MKKTVLGLDLGTNSIGWAFIETESNKILGMGSRIIPMGAELSKFEQGQAQTKNANRRICRGMRKMNKRYKQRRNKLIYVLQKLHMLPEQIVLSSPFDNPLKIDKISILPIEKKQQQYTALDLLELRVTALKQRISLQEFGKIIYLFNQLRGYSGGGNEPEKEDELSEEDEVDKKNDSYTVFCKIIEISEPETIIYKNKPIKKFRLSVETEDGYLHGDTFLEVLKVNESLELNVNIRKSKQGESITFKLPNKTNWRKKMENVEKQLKDLSREKGREIYLSEYLIAILKENRWAKIRNNVILRSRYQSEFDAIWEEQSKHYPWINNVDSTQLLEIASFLFPGGKESQEKYRNATVQNGLKYLIRDQIIYYQRELKDQTHLIAECRFEKGEKAIAKSHPIFQEYKIWEQINKLTINTKVENGKNKKGEIKYLYIDKPIPASLKTWLFDELQAKKEINFSVVLNKLKREYKLRENVDFLNGMNTKAKLSGNETKLLLQKTLGDQLWNKLGLGHENKQIKLWEILYNGKGNEYDLNSERTSDILNFIKDSESEIPNPEQTAIQISKIKFSRNYASLSLKAINKILPLVRAGKYFNYQLSSTLNEKISRLLNETVNDPFEKSVQDFLEKNEVEILTNGGLMNSYATIMVYNQHTEKEYGKDEQVKNYNEIKRLEQGNLRNPLVEQLINETLVVIRDIWKNFGRKPDEIRLELSRDLKNNAERRAKIYSSNRENQKANEEIKNLLVELKEELTLANIEKYKLWLSQENLNDEYIKQYKDPTKTEIEKMKLWKEQGHVSPYTGHPIPLSELFNKGLYDIDHIIPQSRYFDDSFTNKVICERAVNKDKGNKTAMEYFEIGSTIQSVFSKSDYIDHVNRQFQALKRNNLLATKVPDDPINRQIKETQYISVRVKQELNKIVGNDNVKTTTGGVTDYLRNQWGLTDKFKNLLRERYEHIQPMLAKEAYDKYLAASISKKNELEKKGQSNYENEMDEKQFLTSFNKNFIQYKNGKLVIKDWSKRIDHRHHAIDALVVACTKPAHIKRLNDLNKELQTWLDKKRKEFLPDFEGSPGELLEEILSLEQDKQTKIFTQIENFRTVEMPWKGFPEHAIQKVEEIIVSHKPKDKLLIQKNVENKYQIKIRGQLHEGTLYGKSGGLEAYRIPLNKLAGKKFATEKTIEKIANSFLKEAIKDHLKDYEYKKEEAFSVEGILNLNKKLAEKKNIKGEDAPHPPITSIKVFYKDPAKGKKKTAIDDFEDSLQRLDREKAYNSSLYVKTGDNYLFAVMEKDGKRVFDLITFFDAANILKGAFKSESDKTTFKKEKIFKDYFEEKNHAKLLFTLKQGDPVYMGDGQDEVITDPNSPLFEAFWMNKAERARNVFYVTKYSKNKQIYFIKHNIANPILKGAEFGSQNAYEKIFDLSIKEHCIKLTIDRLGNIIPNTNI